VSLHGQRRAATSWSALRKSCANSKAAPEWAIFYILDEPTTGLRFQLLDVLHELVNQGNTAEGARERHALPTCSESQVLAAPTVSAMTAPRRPSGSSPPTVESRAVWCSISALSSAPSRITIAEIHIHIIMPTAAPSEP
jgi:hypothetical protein